MTMLTCDAWDIKSALLISLEQVGMFHALTRIYMQTTTWNNLVLNANKPSSFLHKITQKVSFINPNAMPGDPIYKTPHTQVYIWTKIFKISVSIVHNDGVWLNTYLLCTCKCILHAVQCIPKKGNPWIKLIFLKTVMIYQKKITLLQNSVYPLSFDTSYKMYWPCMVKHEPFQMVMSKLICAK